MFWSVYTPSALWLFVGTLVFRCSCFPHRRSIGTRPPSFRPPSSRPPPLPWVGLVFCRRLADERDRRFAFDQSLSFRWLSSLPIRGNGWRRGLVLCFLSLLCRSLVPLFFPPPSGRFGFGFLAKTGSNFFTFNAPLLTVRFFGVRCCRGGGPLRSPPSRNHFFWFDWVFLETLWISPWRRGGGFSAFLFLRPSFLFFCFSDRFLFFLAPSLSNSFSFSCPAF